MGRSSASAISYTFSTNFEIEIIDVIIQNFDKSFIFDPSNAMKELEDEKALLT